jgi:hypothetical protein
MSNTFLQERNIPAHVLEMIRKLRTRDTADIAVRSLRTLRLSNLVYYAKRGMEYEPLWFWSFLRRLLHLNP